MSVTAYHFWSPTCGPCKVIKPAVEDLKEEFPNVQWITVNTHEDNQNFCQQFGVQVVPTIVVQTLDTTGKKVYSEKQSGTNMANYYRILRNALKFIQQA